MGNLPNKQKGQKGKENKENEIRPNPTIGAQLDSVPLLAHCSDEERALLGGALVEKVYASGTVIFAQDAVGDGFYIVKSGGVKIMFTNPETNEQIEVAALQSGDYFGEAALIKNGELRKASAVSMGCVTLFLSKDRFELLFSSGKIPSVQFANRRVAVSAEGDSKGAKKVQFEEIKKPANALTQKNAAQEQLILDAVSNCSLFQNLNRSLRTRVVDLFYQQSIEAHTAVIRQGDPGINFYVIESGSFEIVVRENKSGESKKVAEFSRGRFFGELALMYNAKRAATCTSMLASTVWVLNRYDFRRLVQQEGEEKARQYLELMAGIKLLAPLAQYERAQLAEALQEVDFEAGQKVFDEGEEGDAMYLIISGHVSITKNGTELARLANGDYFGERALLSGEPRAATVTTVSPSQFLKLDRAAFNLLLGPLQDLLEQKQKSYSSSSVDAKDEQEESSGAVSDVEDLDRSILYSDLQTVAVLGRGSFGFVTLVKHRVTEKAYALKAVSKVQVVETAQEEHIISEKHIMATVHHPFYVNLVTTYSSRDELFFLLEPSLGGELFTTLRKHRFFSEPTARFFAAHVVLGFECMHKKDYVYRDLKPENLLIGADGYLKITDFGFAKKVTSKTYTLCGTPEYLAPEIVSNKGHSKGVDWWCLGILIYEMLVSYTPFYHEDYMQMYNKIARGKFKKAAHLLKNARDIISALLEVTPSKRLGVIKGGADLIKKHAWFKGFDWDKLLARQLPAPIIPTLKNPFDTTNFDPVDTERDVAPYSPAEGANWDANF